MSFIVFFLFFCVCLSVCLSVTIDKSWVLTLAGRGKHHIADFLPKEEMEKFFAKVKSIKEGAPFGENNFLFLFLARTATFAALLRSILLLSCSGTLLVYYSVR